MPVAGTVPGVGGPGSGPESGPGSGPASSRVALRAGRSVRRDGPAHRRHPHRPARPAPGPRAAATRAGPPAPVGPRHRRSRPTARRGHRRDPPAPRPRHQDHRHPAPRSAGTPTPGAPPPGPDGPRGAREDAGPPRPRPLGTGREPARGRRDAGRGRRRPPREPVDGRRGAAGGEPGLLQVGAVRALSGPLLGLRGLEGPEPVRRPSGRQRARQARRGRRGAEDRQRGRAGRPDERLDAREGVAHALEAARLPGDGVPEPAHAGHERAHVLRGGVGVPAAPGSTQLAVRPLEPLRRGPQLLAARGVALARGVEGRGVGAVVDPAVDELVAQRRGVAPTPRDAGDRHGPPPPAAVSSRRPDPGA